MFQSLHNTIKRLRRHFNNTICDNQKTLYENYSNIIIAKDINELTHKILNFDDYKKEFKGDKGVKNILKSSVNLDNKSSVLEYLNFFDKILIK